MNLTRRLFVNGVSAGAAALAALNLSPNVGQAQLVYKHTDWRAKDFDEVLKLPAHTKQVYDIRAIGEGKFLNNIKNSLNGFQMGFDIPMDQIKIVAALHGPSNMLNFDDAMWEKYRLGEFLQVIDPTTGKPAVRNIYFPKKQQATANLSDRTSILQYTSVEALQSRGVQFLSCHTATEEQAHTLVGQYSLRTSPDEVVKDLQAHTLTGTLIVPAMVAAVSLLQSEGHYTYITV